MNEPLMRAYLRYFRDAVVHSKKKVPLPDTSLSGYERFNFREYVVLRAADGSPLRVYRLRPDNTLRRVLSTGVGRPPWPRAMNRPPDGTELYCRIENKFPEAEETA